MRKTPLVNGGIYHICNRSTEGIEIFSTEQDAKRFLKNLNGFNTTGETLRGLKRHPRRHIIDDGEPLVEVYAITLMPNHFHILAKQLVNNGITRWLQRSCNSFSHSFNLIRKRQGTLFMGRFRAISILEHRQLFHILVYIHSNPLDLIFPEWRHGGIKNWSKAKSFLDNYPWSSWGLYVGSRIAILDEIKQIINLSLLSNFVSDYGGLESGVRDWAAADSEEFCDLFLEN